jgi:hypothetical protein
LALDRFLGSRSPGYHAGSDSPASRLPDCMERLVHVANEVDEDRQGFDVGIPQGIAVGKKLLESLLSDLPTLSG